MIKTVMKNRVAVTAVMLAALVFALCGTPFCTEAAANAGINTVEVNNVDEFLAAIAPSTKILMAPGQYNLTEAKTYGDSSASRFYYWSDYGFAGEYGLEIADVDNLTISGEGAEILTVPRCVDVMKFNRCDGIVLDGLTIGHTEAAEACEGGVLFFEDCVSATVSICNLYGCGTVGIWGNNCNDINVIGTDIYHCSGNGVLFFTSRNIKLDKCRIFDCGEDLTYSRASYLFDFYSVRNVFITDSEVFGNFAYGLVYAGDTQNVRFSGLNVHDNHFSYPFSGEGEAEFSGLVLENNVIDAWFDYYDYETEHSFTFDGENLSGEDLSGKYAGQLSSSGIGTAEVDYADIDTSDAKEVHVATADEFIAAVASDTVIVIDVPWINLMDASSYAEFYGDEFSDPDFSTGDCVWRRVYDGLELCIGNVRNLHIRGGKIVTEPRYANVLNFYYCENISLDSISLGHTKEQGSCCGGVVYLNGSENIVIDNCDLYGCGILGVETENVRNLQVQRTIIHDCNQGAALLSNTYGVAFLDCRIASCPDPHFRLWNCSGFSWNRTLMDSDCSFSVDDNF